MNIIKTKMKRAKNLIFIVLTVLILVACNKDMWNPMLPLQEIEGDDLIGLSPRGHIVINDENKISFITDPDGNYRYQISGDEAWADRMLNLIRASSSPIHSL